MPYRKRCNTAILQHVDRIKIAFAVVDNNVMFYEVRLFVKLVQRLQTHFIKLYFRMLVSTFGDVQIYKLDLFYSEILI